MIIILTPNELEIMELLWREDRPLTRAEIIDLSPDKSWKPSAIHILLNSLLKKEMIEVDGFRPTGKNYGRTYAAAVTREGYVAMVLERNLPRDRPDGQLDMVEIFSCLLNDLEVEAETLERLQRMLERETAARQSTRGQT